MFDREVFQQVLSSYKADFLEELWPQEKFKWVAVKQFQDHWDANAENFGSMLEKALAETHNLLATVHFYPRSMILRFAHDFPDETRAMFINLFDESKDAVERIMQFIADADLFKSRYKDRDWGLHYQTANSVSTYLWLRYPDKYYIYKFVEFEVAAKKLEATYMPKAGKNEANLRQHLIFYNEIRDQLTQDIELTQMFSDTKDEACYPDPKGNTLVIDFVYYIKNYFENKQKADTQYWWLNSNPTRWSFSELELDNAIAYDVVNEHGNLRRKHQHFRSAREGDLVIGYEASPTMQIVALARVAKSYDGDYVHFEKLEQLTHPINYSLIREQPDLVNMEFLQNPQGSLFKLTPKEYETVMRLIRQTNPDEDEGMDNYEEYAKRDFLDEVFMSEASYDMLVSLLRNKKNVILQGAPGVGKTFAARRLAYSMIGKKDDSRIEHIQFHQNYTYEDFIMGYKPKGTEFELQNGLFYRFCMKATQNPDQEYFFIVDEINRGNLSKIFGELLMLIEKDYRGTEITLAYNREPFSVPDNLLLIGMMNTADRSLAMIDYALRRRFSFFDMEPAFSSKGFVEYQAGFEDEILDSLIEHIKELNRVIAKDDSLGEGFRIGHSYFCNRMGPPDEWMHEVVNYDILPMLKEYWFDDKSRFQHWESRLRSILSD